MAYRIKQLMKTCDMCPAQWEGETVDGQYVYIRYRWGYLSCSINSREIYGKQLGDSLDGAMSTLAMLNLLSGQIELSSELQ